MSACNGTNQVPLVPMSKRPLAPTRQMPAVVQVALRTSSR
jgi:hypothetical protein